MLSLQQRLSLQQKLSPQQIQYQKLLQLNTLALEQRIKTELELNPILEESMDEELDLEQLEDSNEQDEKDKDNDEEDTYDKKEDEFDVEDFMNEAESDFELERINRSHGEEKLQPIAPQRKSLRDALIDQLSMLDLSEEETILGENIIGSLDKDGYFKTSAGDGPALGKEVQLSICNHQFEKRADNGV